MPSPTQDIDKLIDNLTNLKRAINKFNRNSPTIKVDSKIDNDGFVYIYIEHVTKKDFNRLIDDNFYILKSDNYNSDPYYSKSRITLTFVCIDTSTIDDCILLLNQIFTCLNHDVPKKSEFQEHCELASELVAEWPEWKKNAMKRGPYIYNPPDPQ